MTEPRELSYVVPVEVLAEVTDDKWQLVKLAIGIDRG